MPDDSILGSGAECAHRFASAALGWDLVDLLLALPPYPAFADARR
ncbi:hypothetical protein [Cellulomonas bogoriensis]|nr:hypothetical protein [Cellulomonas bogoriensis]